jgi:hypothetical protein
MDQPKNNLHNRLYRMDRNAISSTLTEPSPLAQQAIDHFPASGVAESGERHIALNRVDQAPQAPVGWEAGECLLQNRARLTALAHLTVGEHRIVIV